MRVIRFLVLLIALAVAFVATPTFELRPFASQIPSDFMADSVLLARFRQWVADDIARSSLILTGWAALTFGLLAVPWPFHRELILSSTTQSKDGQKEIVRRGFVRRIVGLLCLLLTIGGLISMLFFLNTTGETLLVQLLWVGTILSLLLSSALLTTPAPLPASNAPSAGAAQSERRAGDSWRTLMVILLLGGILFSWKLTTNPPYVNELTAQLGIDALAMAHGEGDALFAATRFSTPSEEHPFAITAASSALLYWVTADLLLSVRIVGLLAAMASAVATWLIGVELFARRSKTSISDLPLEDQGQSPALMAAWLVLFNIATLYFSRQPIWLEATAWGLFSCWALLRGFRTCDRLAIALSGVLLGFSYVLHSGSLAYVIALLCWWLGFAAMQLGLLPHIAATKQRHRLHLGDFLLWLLGIGTVLAPFALARGQDLLLWFDQRPTSLESASMILLTNFAPPVDIYPAPLLHMIILPFLPLALGLLLFNLDRRQGWMLTTLLASALAVAALKQSQTLRWELLMPLVPAIALTVAFTLDRLRVTLIRVGGGWTRQFVGFALLGMLLWIASDTLITYNTFAARQITREQALGYLLHGLTKEENVLVYLPHESALSLSITEEDMSGELLGGEITGIPLWRFFTNDRINSADAAIQFVDTLEDPIAPHTIVVLLPEERAAVERLRTLYPGGTMQMQRDIQANPLFVLFTVP